MRKQTIVIIISRFSQTLFRIQVTNTTIGETGSIKIRALGLKAVCDIAFAICDGYTFYPYYDVAVGSKNLEVDAYIQERLKSHNAQCKKEAAANANSNRPRYNGSPKTIISHPESKCKPQNQFYGACMKR